jgi:hypothetical protein
MEQWRELYNTIRPCLSLNYRALAHKHRAGNPPSGLEAADVAVSIWLVQNIRQVTLTAF